MKTYRVVALMLCMCGSAAFSQDTLKIMNWNLLNYVDQARDPYYRTVLRHVKPDVLAVEEMTSQAMVDNFFTSVIDAVFPGQFSKSPFIDGPDTDNELYYKTSKFTFISNTPIRTALRNISEFKLYNATANDTLRMYAVHLKASSGASNEALRAAEVDSFRRVTNLLPIGKYFIVMGDFNIYGSNESAYQKLLEIHAVDDGYFVDPLTMTGTWNNGAYAPYHTQSPRVRAFGGGATGGMDDRFDMILYSRAMSVAGKIQYVPGSLTPIGNDGLHYNDSINQMPNFAVPDSVANALHYAADHLPVSELFVFRNTTSVPPSAELPLQVQLYQNWPNPFNPSTSISFYVVHSDHVSLKVYDVLGREIATLVDAVVGVGKHDVRWNANVAGGVYLYRLVAGESVATKKLILLK